MVFIIYRPEVECYDSKLSLIATVTTQFTAVVWFEVIRRLWIMF